METEVKKTGTTPLVTEGLGGGEVKGVAELKLVMVKYRDGHGIEAIRLAFVTPDGEVYFLDDRAVNLKPAQTWLKNGVAKALNIVPRQG